MKTVESVAFFEPEDDDEPSRLILTIDDATEEVIVEWGNSGEVDRFTSSEVYALLAAFAKAQLLRTDGH